MYQVPLKSVGPNRNRNRALPSVLLFFLAIFAAICILLGGFAFYNNRIATARAQKTSELKSILNLKIQQVVDWRDERFADLEIYSTDQSFNLVMDQWLAAPEDDTLSKSLLSRFSKIAELEGYWNILVTDPEGGVLLSVQPDVGTLDTATKNLSASAYSNRDSRMSDFTINPQNGKQILNFAAPLMINGQSMRAVLVFQVDANLYLFPVIQTWPIASPSAEALLMRLEGGDVVYLNPVRFIEQAPIDNRVALGDADVTSTRAGSGEMGASEGKDYRGHKVLSVIDSIPGTNWFIEVKVDSSEYAGQISIFAILVITSIFLLAGLLGVYIYNRRQHNLLQVLSRSESEIRKAHEEIRTTLYSIGDAVITTDAEGLITRMNPQAERLTGWVEKKAVGLPLNTIFNIINETTREEVENPAQRVISEGIVVGLANHTVLIDREGNEHPIADSSAPILDANGKLTGVVLVFRDQTEERLKEHERTLLNFTIANSLNEVYLFDAETLHFRFVNEGALKNLGFSLDEMYSKTPLDISPEVSRAQLDEMLAPLLNHEKTRYEFEVHNRRADGSHYPVKVHIQLFEYAEDRVFLGLAVDLTERDVLLAGLQENEARLLQTQSAAHLGSWEITLKNNSMWGSEEAFRIYGLPYTSSILPLDQVKKIPLAEERERMDMALKNLIAKNEKYDIEFRIRRENDGEIRVIHSIAKLGLDRHGNPEKILGVVQDITDMRKIEQSLVESEQRYRVMFNDNKAVMLLIHPDTGMIVDANQAAVEYYGWTRDELLEMTINQINTLPLNDLKVEMQNAFLQKRVYFQFQHRLKNHEIRDVEAFSSKIIIGNEPLLYSIIHDVTARRQAEAKVREQMDELMRWQKVTEGWVSPVLELKQEVNELLVQLGKPKRYESVTEDNGHD